MRRLRALVAALTIGAGCGTYYPYDLDTYGLYAGDYRELYPPAPLTASRDRAGT